MRYNILEDFSEEREHDHTPLFNFVLINVDKAKDVDNYQGSNPHGKVNMIIKESASYKVCVIPRKDGYIFEKSEIIKVAISFDIIDNKTEKDVSGVVKNKDFDKINNKMAKIHKKIIDVMKTQNYQIMKEDDYSNKQNENSIIIVYGTVVQIGIILVLTIWQVSSLKNLFKDSLNI